MFHAWVCKLSGIFIINIIIKMNKYLNKNFIYILQIEFKIFIFNILYMYVIK